MNLEILHDQVRRMFPALDTLPYCQALEHGRFDREAVLRAERVELYRATRTRERVHDAYHRRLQEARNHGDLTDQDLRQLHAVLEDEGANETHADHLDLRRQLFSRASPHPPPLLLPLDEELEPVNQAWLAIAEGSSAYGVIALHGAIEEWYVPVSGFFEEQYLRRGFTPTEVETYTIHKTADAWHAARAWEVLARHADRLDAAELLEAVRHTFTTVRAYDERKLLLASRG